MESLSEILSGASAPDKSEPVQAPEAPSEPVKDDKPAESETPAASAPSAEQAKTEPKADDKADKPAEAPAKEADSQLRDDKGKFVKPDDEETVIGLRNALHAARKQKQELERKAREAEERAAAAAKPKEEQAPKEDFWADPERALNERDQKLQRDLDSRIFRLSERYAMKQHADYEQVMTELEEDCKSDSALAATAMAQANSDPDEPAEALYRFAVNRKALKAVGGDLNKFKEEVASPFKASIAEKEKAIADKDRQLSEQAEKIKSLQSQLDRLGKVPSSLNKEPSASRATVDVESTEPPSLAAIVEPRKRRA